MKKINFLTVQETPDEKRKRYSPLGVKKELTEAAVQLAVAIELLKLGGDSGRVKTYPDGMHAKQFSIPNWMHEAGFNRIEQVGRTEYGGIYRRGKQTIKVNPKPGKGDVVGEIGGQPVIVECKGGVINTTYAGEISKLRRGLCEAVGLLMTREVNGGKQFVAIPDTPQTRKMVNQLKSRCSKAGIYFMLVKCDGSVDRL